MTRAQLLGFSLAEVEGLLGLTEGGPRKIARPARHLSDRGRVSLPLRRCDAGKSAPIEDPLAGRLDKCVERGGRSLAVMRGNTHHAASLMAAAAQQIPDDTRGVLEELITETGR